MKYELAGYTILCVKNVERMREVAETTFFVKEATSAQPIQTLETMLAEMDGIERALVDTEDGEVKIQFDETKVSEERIAITLQQHGFHINQV